MSYDNERGRADLEEFGATQPENFWRADAHIRRVIGRWAGEDKLRQWEEDFDVFGAEAAGFIDAAVRTNNLTENLPVLDRFDGFGERIEEVAHHPSYHTAGRGIYGSGMMTALGEPEGHLRSLTLFYLSSQNGEAGHNCPLACTAGLIKTLRAVGSNEQRELYLQRLLLTDYELLAHGAQFLTEVQGGSDVGANALRAEPVEGAEGEWRLSGEKWFCSNVTADLMLVTARPEGSGEGTRGLGLFLVPRRLEDRSLNAFHIRRLKDKLGTRTMATAEVDFDAAVAFQVGSLEDGFRNVMRYVINTSRIFNAVACSGAARRACTVAHGYAEHREGFGAPILGYPLVQETLADMRAETAAMTSGSMQLVHLLDEEEGGRLDAEHAAFVRVALNLNKTRTAIAAHEVINSGIEILGGNGTVETFSVLPRLLRDNVVFENWEGSHNVLLLQVLRDCQRKGLHEGFFSVLAGLVSGHARLEAAVRETAAAFKEMLVGDAALATIRMRELGAKMSYLHWAAAMLQDGTERELVDHFVDRRIGPKAPRDAAYLGRIASLSKDA